MKNYPIAKELKCQSQQNVSAFFCLLKCFRSLFDKEQSDLDPHNLPSGSVVECLTRDREAAGSSLTGLTALWSLSKTHYPSLVLGQPRKIRPCLTERLLMGRKEKNQTNKQTQFASILILVHNASKYLQQMTLTDNISDAFLAGAV